MSEEECVVISRADLVRLLSAVGDELDRQECALRAPLGALHAARYGQPADPFVALDRDSAMLGERRVLDDDTKTRVTCQLTQLEQLVAAHKKSYSRAKAVGHDPRTHMQILVATEKRHAKALRELELEKERKTKYAAQGDDVVAFLETQRAKLQQQADYALQQASRAQHDAASAEARMHAEREKHKVRIWLRITRQAMILFLIGERKQLLLRLHEARLATATHTTHTSIELERARADCETLAAANKALRAENMSLKEVAQQQEADLLALRRNAIKQHDSLTVVANRAARMPTSTSFGSALETSRLPRAAAPSKAIVTSPAKKTPVMGIGITTTRHTKFTPSAEPELEQLEQAIQRLDTPSRTQTKTSAKTPTRPLGLNEQPLRSGTIKKASFLPSFAK